jgi:hypothetical protein
MPSHPLVLAINCGSSSLKYGVYSTENEITLRQEGEAQEIGHPGRKNRHPGSPESTPETLFPKRHFPSRDRKGAELNGIGPILAAAGAQTCFR